MELQGSNVKKLFLSSILLRVQNLRFEIIALIASSCLVTTAEPRYRHGTTPRAINNFFF